MLVSQSSNPTHCILHKSFWDCVQKDRIGSTMISLLLVGHLISCFVFFVSKAIHEFMISTKYLFSLVILGNDDGHVCGHLNSVDF